MNRTWLIQRLERPCKDPSKLLFGKDNPFVFGGGGGRLSPQALDLLRPLFQFDYMGSAEFEYGAVPEALDGMVKCGEDFTAGEVSLKLSDIKIESWEKKQYKKIEKGAETKVFFFCRTSHREYVTKLINDLVFDSRKVELKQGAHLREALLDRADGETFNKRVCGWLELDNGFFFFTDREMFDGVVKLFTEGSSK